MTIETLRPNAPGDECNITDETSEACPNHYLEVDDVVADDGTTQVYQYTQDVWRRDLYNIENHSVGSGTINKITVYARHRPGSTIDQASLKIAIKTGGVAYESSEITPPENAWATYNNEWTQNPGNAHAWTWDEIDALQIGINLRGSYSGGAGVTRCTQVYVVVDYTPVAVGRSFGYIMG